MTPPQIANAGIKTIKVKTKSQVLCALHIISTDMYVCTYIYIHIPCNLFRISIFLKMKVSVLNGNLSRDKVFKWFLLLFNI